MKLQLKSALLSLLMIVLATPAWAEVTYSQDKQTITFSGDGILTHDIVVKAMGNKYSYDYAYYTVEIGEGITEIGESAFDACKSLYTIHFSNTVTKIETFAFRGCTNLMGITIPATVTYVGTSAFVASGIKTATVLGKGLQQAVFASCEELTTVDMSESEEISFGYALFYMCNELRSITLPKNLQIIGEQAFYDCYNLSGSLKMPASIAAIYDQAFAECRYLNEIVFINYPVTYGQPFDDRTKITKNSPTTMSEWLHSFNDVNKIRHILIPNDIVGSHTTSLGRSFKYIRYAYIAPEVTILNDNLFNKCAGLEEIFMKGDYQNELQTIGNNTFAYCMSLKNIEDIETYGTKLSTIGEKAFYKCSALETLNFHRYYSYGLSSIGASAFEECTKLKEVQFSNYAYSAADLAIGERAFASCPNIESITITRPVKSIGNYAFQGCDKLTKIGINSNEVLNPATPYTLESNLITRFPSATDLYLYENYTKEMKPYIGENAFASTAECPSMLQTLNFTEYNQPEIGEGAFMGNQKLTTIQGDIKSVAASAFIQCTSLKSVSFTGVSEVGLSAFYGCTGLEQVTLPEGLVSIGEVAFMGCSGLKKVVCYKPEPIYLPTTAFDYFAQQQAELFVPKESVEAYKAAESWKNFFKITDATGINSIKMDSQKAAGIFTLDGKKIANAESLPAGIYIKNGKKVVIK